MRFIDLFAGLGGFHLALSHLGHECVFASEIQPKLQKLYKLNYPETPIYGDITKIEVEDIPAHDILCGGFPCQPFSFAGKKQGFMDYAGRGNMFGEIVRVLRHHHPRYIFLENVSALPGHDGGNTWQIIKEHLDALGYEIESRVYSPHEFGIPQHRPRFYIVGRLRGATLLNCDPCPVTYDSDAPMKHFSFPEPEEGTISDVHTIVDENDCNNLQLVRRSLHPVFDAWQEFVYKIVEHDGYMPGHCIYTMEFGSDYDFEDTPPAFQSADRLKGKHGAFGKLLEGDSQEQMLADIPFYMQKTKYKDTYPEFKKVLIRQNRELYRRNKEWIDPWLKKIRKFPRTQQMFEWSTDQSDYDLHNHVIQLRPSGIRIRSTNFVPTITLCTTATPILPWVGMPKKGKVFDKNGRLCEEDDFRWGRYISHNEAARIMCMDSLNFGNLSRLQKLKALGNAVNVDVVEKIAKELI